MIKICALHEIAIGAARGFTCGNSQVLIMRLGTDIIAAYLNRCPHLGVPLNWEANRFMDNEARLLRCATHGALFEPETGMCVQGPCKGEQLWQLVSKIEGDEVYIDDSELQ